MENPIQENEEKLSSLWNELAWGEPSDNLMNSGDPFVETALREMESCYGITREDLEKCYFIAIRSPLSSETVDVCFGHNWNLVESAGLGTCQYFGVSYAKYLGRFMIVMDAETGEVLRATHAVFNANIQEGTGDGLLSRRDWSKEDLPEYYQMMADLKALDDGYVAGRDSLNALMNEADRLMLSYRGNPELYTASREDDSDVFTVEKFLYRHNLTREQIQEKGTEYLLEHTAYTQEELGKASFVCDAAYDDSNHPDMEKTHPKLLVILGKEDDSCVTLIIEFDLNLHVTGFEEFEGPSNG